VRFHVSALGCALLLSLSLACGRVLPTKISDLLEDPRKYDGTTVTVSGEVTTSANLVLLKFFKVRDKTGEITVITQNAVPRRGASVRVRGVLHQAFVVGDESLTVINEEP